MVTVPSLLISSLRFQIDKLSWINSIMRVWSHVLWIQRLSLPDSSEVFGLGAPLSTFIWKDLQSYW